MAERITVNSKKPVSIKENLISHKQKTDFQSNSSPVNQILHLQRTIGNQAVQRMVRSGALQAKLRIGQPGDVYEQEADRVADEVMRMPEPGVQRQVGPEEEEEEMLQAKPLAEEITPLVQRQLEPEEEEEETLQTKPLANQITPLVQVQRQEELEEEEEETLQAAEEITPLVQRQVEPEEEEELQMQPMEEEELMQGKFASGLADTLQTKPEASQNNTGMPDHLKSGLENLSSMNLSSVRVHHNSSKPAQLNALAYTQGQDIHVGPGQEKHLPHEGWHAVQQMQGRVNPTMHAKGMSINDDAGLEREADVMGKKALQMSTGIKQLAHVVSHSGRSKRFAGAKPIVQRRDWKVRHKPVKRTPQSKAEPTLSMSEWVLEMLRDSKILKSTTANILGPFYIVLSTEDREVLLKDKGFRRKLRGLRNSRTITKETYIAFLRLLKRPQAPHETSYTWAFSEDVIKGPNKRLQDLVRDKDILAIGDRLTINVTFGGITNVEEIDQFRMGTPSYKPPKGVKDIRVNQGWNDSVTAYKWEVVPLTPGKTIISIESTLPRGSTLNYSRELVAVADNTWFKWRCSTAASKIAGAYSHLHTWMYANARQFDTAYHNHETTLTKQAESDALVESILLGIFFAGVGGAVGGLVSQKLKNIAEKNGNLLGTLKDSLGQTAIIDCAKDISKYGARIPKKFLKTHGKIEDEVGMTDDPENSKIPVAMGSINPFQWFAKLAQEISSEKVKVYGELISWMESADNAYATDPSYLWDFDPVSIIDGKLTHKGRKINSLEIPSQTWKYYEGSIWGEWFQRNPESRVALLFFMSTLRGHIKDQIITLTGSWKDAKALYEAAIPSWYRRKREWRRRRDEDIGSAAWGGA